MPPATPHRKRRRVYNEPGHAHELTFSCQHRLKLLNNDRTRSWFIDSLAEARRKHQFQLWAYVIMPEHVHLLMYPPHDHYDISTILHDIKKPVAREAIAWLQSNSPTWLNRLRVQDADGGFENHFWLPGGGYDRNIRSAETAWKVVDYIHANPCRRGLAATPTDWPWSSARWYAGMSDVKLEMDGTPYK